MSLHLLLAWAAVAVAVAKSGACDTMGSAQASGHSCEGDTTELVALRRSVKSQGQVLQHDSSQKQNTFLNASHSKTFCIPQEEWNRRKPDFQHIYKTGVSFGKHWTFEEAEVWYRQSFPVCQVAVQNNLAVLQKRNPDDISFYSWQTIAKNMGSVEWGSIKWGPLDEFGQKTKSFAVGGGIVNGLLYGVAFAQSVGDGQTNWMDLVTGLGAVLGPALAAIPEVGPILSVAVTVGLALFGSQDNEMKDLYKSIMKEVNQIVEQNDVQEALNLAKGQLAGFMNMFSGLPLTFMIDSQMKDKEFYMLMSLNDYKGQMEAEEQNVFGYNVKCLELNTIPLTTQEKPGKECTDFWGNGAILFQTQYVLIYLNLLAQMAVLTSNSTLRSAVLDTLRDKAETYYSLLQASKDGFYDATPAHGTCEYSYNFQPDWGKHTANLSNDMWGNQSISCITGCIAYGTDSTVDPHFGIQTNMCWHRYDTTWSSPGRLTHMCTQVDFDHVVAMKKAEINATFDPILAGIKNLTQETGLSNAKELANWIVKQTPQPPQPPANSSIPGASEFCDYLCLHIMGNALVINQNIYARSVKEQCINLCLKSVANARMVTRCSCTTTLCPEIGDEFYSALTTLQIIARPFNIKEILPKFAAKVWQMGVNKTMPQSDVEPSFCKLACLVFPMGTLPDNM